MTDDAPLLLAGDVGGTKTNLALFSAASGGPVVLAEQGFHNDDYASLAAVAAASSPTACASTSRAATFPLLVRLAAPNSLAFFVQACVSMTEVWYVGRLGRDALAAIALAFPLVMLMQTLSGGAMGGAVARAIGAGRNGRAEALVWGLRQADPQAQPAGRLTPARTKAQPQEAVVTITNGANVFVAGGGRGVARTA